MHIPILEEVLQRARAINLKLSIKRCTFCPNSVSYVGLKFTKHGLKPDDDKIKTINEIIIPDGPAPLEKFIGMLNYLHKFIDNFSEKIALVRQLLCIMVLGHTATNSIEARNRSNPSVLSFQSLKKTSRSVG